MKSIRAFLIIATLSTMVLVVFVSAVQGYRSGMTEAERLADSQLLEMAQFSANLRTDQPLALEQPAHVAYQIWALEDGQPPQLLSRTRNAPEKALADFAPGFDFANFGGYRWRTHAYFPPESNRVVLAAMRTDIRFQLVENVILEAIYPIVIGLPLSGLLIWLIISRGLTPLRTLAAKLQEKQHRDLSPVELEDTPAELGPVIQSVNGLLSRLSAAFEREKRFASDAAHELRTPISVLKLQLHNLEQQYPNEAGIGELKTGVARMQHLVEQILALYRASPEQLTANFVPVNLKELTAAVIADNYHLFESKHQHIELVADLDSRLTLVEGEPFALRTLLTNLLSNASKYTPAQGQVVVTLERDSGGLHLQVEDNGRGIPADQRALVFQRFHRLGGDQHDSGETGCGLGLAIVDNIATLHGATISIRDSRFPQGTSFELTFPPATSENLQ